IPGIELSSCYNQMTRVHILGYFLDFDTPATKTIIQQIRIGHLDRERLRLNLLKKTCSLTLNFETLEKAIGDRVPNWRTVAQALVNSGDAENIEDASRKFLERGAPGHVSYSMPWPKVPSAEAVKAIKADHGIAILAHPGDLTENREAFFALLAELSRYGLDGFETTARSHHTALDPKLNEYLQSEWGLIGVHGADYHGDKQLESHEISRESHLLLLLIASSRTWLQSEPILSWPLRDLISPLQQPLTDSVSVPQGAVESLENSGINSVGKLLDYVHDAARTPIAPALLRMALILLEQLYFRCLVGTVTEEIILQRSEEKQLDSPMTAESQYDALCSKTEASLSGICTSMDLQIAYPLGYRGCLYYKALLRREAFLHEIRVKSFLQFKTWYEGFSIWRKHGDKYLDVVLSNVLNLLALNGYVPATTLRRGLKSLGSAYEKFVRLWLLGPHAASSIPESVADYFRKDSQLPQKETYYWTSFAKLFPDLYAATILIPDNSIKAYDDLAKIEFGQCFDLLREKTSHTRRWYHKRYYLAGICADVPIEIIIKTVSDHWYSRYHYFLTKKVGLFSWEDAADNILASFITDRARDVTREDELVEVAWLDICTKIRQKRL